jgi:plastocyanin
MLSPHISSKAESGIQTGVKGSVELPAEIKQQRVFRGRAYRNRQAEVSKEPMSAADRQKQNYQNTIISLHPLSFEAELKKSGVNEQVIQREATFIPKVTVVTEGSTVEFVNDDPFFHNVFSLTKGARFNIGRRPKGDVYPVEIPTTEWKEPGMGQISLFCDIHSQMNAVILTLDTPYFTRVYEDGTYSIIDVPEGRYELKMYNPSYDVVSMEITLGTEVKELDLSF